MDAQVTDSAADPMMAQAIPNWKEVPDYFVWDAFNWASRDPDRRIGSEAKQQELLLAETTSFYVIPDQFGVVAGHLLVLPKARATSIACLGIETDEEIAWLVNHASGVVESAYNAQAVIAEHGECGCATASQAHIHVLPLQKALTPEALRGIVNDVLARRMVGIERIRYRRTEFTALDDLQDLINADGVEIIGAQLTCADFPGEGPYPAAARAVSGLVHPYVYFDGPGVRFISIRSLRSQFVREVVSIAVGQPSGAWDRRVHASRTNMFATFDGLASAFGTGARAMYGFKARGNNAQIAFPRPARGGPHDAGARVTVDTGVRVTAVVDPHATDGVAKAGQGQSARDHTGACSTVAGRHEQPSAVVGSPSRSVYPLGVT